MTTPDLSAILPPQLLPHHRRELIDGSGLDDAIVASRGYYSATTIEQLHGIGFTNLSTDNLPALVIPIHGVDATQVSYQVKPDKPRIRDGKPLKYESLPGRPPVVDVHPLIHYSLSDPSIPLWITEGSKKADSAVRRHVFCLALPGVWSWRGKNSQGGITELPDWDRIAIKGRVFYLAFDSDVMTKPEVQRALRRLASMLKRRGAKEVKPIVIPQLGDAKVGLDDWFVAGHSSVELQGLVDNEVLRPVGIVCNNRSMPEITSEALSALVDANMPPTIFVRDGRLCRIKTNENGEASIEDFNHNTMRATLARVANWVKKGKEAVEIFPPKDVVDDVLAMGDYPDIPPIERVIESPQLDPTGSISMLPGYNPALKSYLASSETWREWTGSTAEALALLNRLLSDFPFVSDADYAHALGLMLLPVVRSIIDGPTPFNLFNAPTQASGKSLGARVCMIPTMGPNIYPTDAPKNPEEWEKKLTTALRSVPSYVFFDNLTHRIESSALDIAFASSHWSGRILSQSINIHVPVRCVWVGTSNNAILSTDITRRTVMIRIDAQVERPADRSGWQIPDLEKWVCTHRQQIVAAICCLVQDWVDAGSKPWAGKPLATFEEWSKVIGGILAHHGVTGFLGNLKEVREAVDSTAVAWGQFYGRWHNNFENRPVRAGELLAEFEQDEELAGLVAAKDESGRKAKLGHLLKRRVKVIANGYRIEMVGHFSGSCHYRIVPMPEPKNTKPHGKTPIPPVKNENPTVENSNNLGSNEPIYRGVCGVCGVIRTSCSCVRNEGNTYIGDQGVRSQTPPEPHGVEPKPVRGVLAEDEQGELL